MSFHPVLPAASPLSETIPDPAPTAVSAQALREELVALVLPAIRSSLAEVGARVNRIVDLLK